MFPKKLHKNAFSLIELSIVILIIGILVAGVTQGSRLVTEFRLNTARTLTQSSPVASIEGIYMWLESTGSNAIDVADPEDQQEVSTWNDINPQSPTKNNLSQGTTASKPKINFGQINNNLPVVSFDGVNDFLSRSATFQEISPTNQLTVFIVGKLKANTATQVLLAMEHGGINRIGIEFDNALPRFDFVTLPALLVSSTNVYNLTQLFTFHKNASTQTIYLNGAQDVTRSNLSTFSSTGSYTLYLGQYYAGLRANFDLGEIIIFSRGLKTEERKAVESYLGKKWELKVS